MKDNIIEDILELSKLSISDEEKNMMENELNEFINFISKVNNIKTGQKDISFDDSNYNVLREDMPKESFERDELLKNTPEVVNGMIKVPKVFD